jgi:hypothetical protein
MKLNNLDYADLLKLLMGKDKFFTDKLFHNNVLIRHDVDDKIENSVKMAELEHLMGVKSTYFMLDTADYFYRSFDEMRHIQSLGHKVEWHNNALISALQAEFRMVEDKNIKVQFLSQWIQWAIEAPLSIMRLNGLNVVGSASHGDALCAKYGVVNYEIWSAFPRKNTFMYSPFLMESFGLQYEAYQFNKGYYLSDSGGKWNVPDPIAYIEKWNKDGDNPLQILVHPQHYSE